MLHIRCGGRIDINGRTAVCDRPVALRTVLKENRPPMVLLVAQPTGQREITLPHTICGLRVTNTRVHFAASRERWTARKLRTFRLQLHRGRIYNLPCYLARTVRIHTHGTGNTIDTTDATYRSRQAHVDISECAVNVLHKFVVERNFIVSTRPDRATIDEIWVGAPRTRATRTAPPPVMHMRSALAHLLFAPIMHAGAAGDLERMIGLLSGAIGFTPVTDETTPDPAGFTRSALADRVSRLTTLASIRGSLYAAETDLMAWLRSARPKLVERLGTHQLADAVAEAAAALASTRIVHQPRPPHALPAAGDPLCDLCCERPRTMRVCARCADSVLCAGCVDRLVLETDKPACPLCRGPLQAINV